MQRDIQTAAVRDIDERLALVTSRYARRRALRSCTNVNHAAAAAAMRYGDRFRLTQIAQARIGVGKVTRQILRVGRTLAHFADLRHAVESCIESLRGDADFHPSRARLPIRRRSQCPMKNTSPPFRRARCESEAAAFSTFWTYKLTRSTLPLSAASFVVTVKREALNAATSRTIAAAILAATTGHAYRALL
jgi:hypothetical protein